MSTLRALIEQASGYVDALFDPADILTPYYIAEAADGGLTVVAVAAVGPTLDSLRREVELQLRLQGKRRWVFFSEAFLAEYAAGESATVDPVDHPERIDVVIFEAVEVQGGRRLTATRQVYAVDEVKQLMPLVICKGPVRFRPSVAVGR